VSIIAVLVFGFVEVFFGGVLLAVGVGVMSKVEGAVTKPDTRHRH
jgi:hypothetical protein